MSDQDQTSARSLSEPFLQALEDLAQAEHGGWWRDALAHPDLVLAVRRESLNLYHRGASLYRIAFGAGRITAETHAKYLVRQRQALARLGLDGGFSLDPQTAVWTGYEGRATLDEMMRAAAALTGVEKTGLHQLVLASPNVIDVEIALTGGPATATAAAEPGADTAEPDLALLDAAPAPSRARPDRIDAASLEARDSADEAWLVFHEAKHAANTELRAAPSREPAIVGQIARYRTALTREADRLAKACPALCQALVRLHALRCRVRITDGVREADLPRLDPLIAEVASGRRRLRVDPEPRLIVFGFDADQREGVLGVHLKRLRDGYGLRIHAVGSPNAKASAAFR